MVVSSIVFIEASEQRHERAQSEAKNLEKYSLHRVNEHFEKFFNDVLLSAVVIQRFLYTKHRIIMAISTWMAKLAKHVQIE